MTVKRYAYAKREWERRRFYLDYNEYMGRIHPGLAADFDLERIARHYAFGSTEKIAEHFATAWGFPTPAFCTHGADEALFHTLLWFRLNWDPTRRRRPRIAIQHRATYDHMLSFAAGLKYDVLAPDCGDSVNADILYLCSPNNPTGDITRLQSSTCELLILDRTYDDYMPEAALERDRGDINGLFKSNPAVAIVKSFAKAYPIGGFRLGIIATNVADLNAHFFNVYNRKLVTDAAMTVAQHCIDYSPFYDIERRSIFEARAVIASELRPITEAHNIALDVPEGGNFIVARGSAGSLADLAEAMQSVGVSIRLKESAGLARLTSVSESFLGELFERFDNLKKRRAYAAV